MLSLPAGTPVASAALISRQGLRGVNWHNGIDLGAPRSTPAFPIAPGTVEIACAFDTCNVGTYGQLVLIRHSDDVFSVYAHLDTVLVEEGQAITLATQLGTVGSTTTLVGRNGRPKSETMVPHLHLEIVRSWPLGSRDTDARYDVLGELAAAGVVLEGSHLVATGVPVEYHEMRLAQREKAATFDIAPDSEAWKQWLKLGLAIGSIAFVSVLAVRKDLWARPGTFPWYIQQQRRRQLKR